MHDSNKNIFTLMAAHGDSAYIYSRTGDLTPLSDDRKLINPDDVLLQYDADEHRILSCTMRIFDLINTIHAKDGTNV